MGETRVDLLHLLEDLRDAYPGALEETILTEIVANSLDSGATALTFTTDPAQATLTVVDNGAGMRRRELARYHDLAETSKTRGQGIGFAGVGIKLGLLACETVLTETRRGKTHVATSWHLASRHRAPWKWVNAPGLAEAHGTAVRLTLANPLSPLLEGGFLEATLQRHFNPLFDATFDELLAAHYPEGVRFVVNGEPLRRRVPTPGRAPLWIRIGRKRKPSAVGYLVRDAVPLPEEQRGVAISTLGKVIKRGWDWLGLSSATPDQVGGLIEVPALADCLTLSKGDFIRAGARGMTYLAYRRAMQEAVAGQLAAWGDSRGGAEAARRRRTRPLERDLQAVLVDLAEQFPLLATLVERQRGGQQRLPMGAPGEGREGLAAAAGSAVLTVREEAATARAEAEAGENMGGAEPAGTAADGSAPAEGAGGAPAEAAPSGVREPVREGPALPGGPGPRRPARYGLTIQFESRPDNRQLGWLVESTVWVNEAHPAYRRAVASRSDGYHVALTVAMALAPLAVEPPEAHDFVTAFLARWGEAIDREPSRRGRRGRST